MTGTRETIETTDGPMPAHLWLPAAGSGPGILLLQEIFGVSSYIERRAQDLADLGYVVLAPELFWRYETADHAFDNDDFFLHDAEASALAWERTTAWLGAQLVTRG